VVSGKETNTTSEVIGKNNLEDLGLQDVFFMSGRTFFSKAQDDLLMFPGVAAGTEKRSDPQ
jgi:hypothetical protein